MCDVTIRTTETRQRVIAPAFPKQLKSCDIAAGTQYVMECHVTGTPAPEVAWYCDDHALSSASQDYILSQVNGRCTLKIRKLTSEHTAVYSCKARNSGGEAVTTAKLNVISKQPSMTF